MIEENTNGGEKSEPTWTWRQVWDLIADDWWLFALAIAAAFGASVFRSIALFGCLKVFVFS